MGRRSAAHSTWEGQAWSRVTPPADPPPLPMTRTHSPADDLLVVTADEDLLLRREDADSVFLACPGLSVADLRAQVHVEGALRQRAGLRTNHSAAKFTGANSMRVSGDQAPQGPCPGDQLATPTARCCPSPLYLL